MSIVFESIKNIVALIKQYIILTIYVLLGMSIVLIVSFVFSLSFIICSIAEWVKSEGYIHKRNIDILKSRGGNRDDHE